MTFDRTITLLEAKQSERTMKKSAITIVALAFTAVLAACGGGGGGAATPPTNGGGGTSPTPTTSPTSSPTTSPTSSPTSSPTASPTSSPTATPATVYITGKIVDAQSGAGITGLTVAAAPASSAFTAMMAGSSAPSNANVATATTASDGTFKIACGTALTYGGVNYCSINDFYFSAYGGASYGFNSFHGQFASTNTYGAGGSGLNTGTLKLTDPTAEEVTNVAHVNAFRAAPGPGNLYGGSGVTYPTFSSNALYGVNNTLVMDENLIEVAKYWAGEVHAAGKMGHTCAAIGNPPGCIEQSAYYASLPGEPSSATTDGDAATGFSAWTGNGSAPPYNGSAQTSFEYEGANDQSGYYGGPMNACATVWDAKTCTGGDPPAGAGHFIAEMSATQWIGLGEVEGSGATNAFMEELK